jgi:hypothetical protein
MLASNTKKPIKVGEETVTVRKLSYTALKRAADLRETARARVLRDFGGDVLKAFRAQTQGTSAQAGPVDVEKLKKTRYDGFDRESVLVGGIVSWTLNVPANPENIADLEDDAARVIFEAILDLSLPPVDVKAVEELGKDA